MDSKNIGFRPLLTLDTNRVIGNTYPLKTLLESSFYSSLFFKS